MAGRDPYHAVQRHVERLNRALQAVTRDRLVVRERQTLRAGSLVPLAIGDLDDAPLRGRWPLGLAVGQVVRIVEDGEARADDRFTIVTVQYVYELTAGDGREVLAFHWTPEAVGANVITFPHLHIGPVLTSGQTTIRPGDVHKAHIPTGVVTLPAVIRLTIAEFGVRPLRPDWDDVLQDADRSFS